MQKTTEILVEYKVSDVSNNNAWKKLVQEAIDKNRFEEFVFDTEEAEKEFMELYFSDDPNAKKKNGKWKKTYCLPKAYLSARSVIDRALQNNIDLHDGSSIYGKTEIERRIQEHKIKIKTISVKEIIQKHAEELSIFFHKGYPEEVINALNQYHILDDIK